MRSIHAKLILEYRKESVKFLRQWEKLEVKMADFQNHRRFMLRCLSKGLVPVSIRLKTTVKTPKGNYIVRQAERMLMNERVRLIKNTITMLRWQIDTCIYSLGRCIRMEAMEECHRFISLRRERRHQSTLERQTKKFNLLWQRNTGGLSNYQHGGNDWEVDTRETPLNNENLTDEATNIETTQATTTTTTTRATTNNNKWVHNLSKTPLLKDQEKVLARGPNYAVVAREPPVGKYIAQIERMCQNLDQGKVEELRGEVKSILRNIQTPKCNISKEEAKAIQELKRDQDRLILTADKGVSMVVMDKEDYRKKSENLLKQPPIGN